MPCPKSRTAECTRPPITPPTIKAITVYSFFSSKVFCFVFQTMGTAICTLLQWLNELIGWAISGLLWFFKETSHVHNMSWLFSFSFHFFFCQQNCNSEGLMCYFVQYSETIKQPACYQLLNNSPLVFFPLLTGYHPAMLCALDSVIAGAQGKPAATKRGIPSICI